MSANNLLSVRCMSRLLNYKINHFPIPVHRVHFNHVLPRLHASRLSRVANVKPLARVVPDVRSVTRVVPEVKLSVHQCRLVLKQREDKNRLGDYCKFGDRSESGCFKCPESAVKEGARWAQDSTAVSTGSTRWSRDSAATPIGSTRWSRDSPATPPLIVCGLLAWLGLQQEEEGENGLILTMKRGILAVRNGDFQKADQMFHLALRMATDLEQEEAKTHIYSLLANSALEQGMVGQAERLFTTVLQRILAAGTRQDSNAVVEISLKLANIFLQNENVKKAEQGFNFCVDTMQRKIASLEVVTESPSDVAEDAEDPDDTIALWGMCLDQRGQFLIEIGRLEEAEDMFKKAQDAAVRVHGEQHEQTLVVINSLATVLSMRGQYSEAVALLTDVIARARKVDTPFLATFLVNLGLVRLRQGLIQEAEKCCKEGATSARERGDAETEEQADRCLQQIKVGALD